MMKYWNGDEYVQVPHLAFGPGGRFDIPNNRIIGGDGKIYEDVYIENKAFLEVLENLKTKWRSNDPQTR